MLIIQLTILLAVKSGLKYIKIAITTTNIVESDGMLLQLFLSMSGNDWK